MNKEWSPQFPVFLYHEGLELPKEGNYFVVAGNGTWMHKNTGVCSCFVPVENISFLDDLEEKTKVSIDILKIPFEIIFKIKHFFELVLNYANSEAAVILYYNPDTGHYIVKVPIQTVSHTSVFYEKQPTLHLEEMQGYLCVGTIHSHCDFDAFHSGVDINDESNFDGIHITFGNNDKEEFSITASVVVNGYREQVDPLNFIEGVKRGSDNYVFDREPLKNWELESYNWLKNVKNKDLNDFILSSNSYVDWSSDINSDKLKKEIGEGPFLVLSRKEKMIKIKTQSGVIELSKIFFMEN